MLRICSTILILSLLVSPLARAEESSTVGARLEIGFYTRIHDNIDKTTDILRKKQLSSFKTFAGFGNKCRPKTAWLDREAMNEGILRELTYGNLGPLADFMAKNKTLGTSDTPAFHTIATCLTETYAKMGEVAAQSEKTASTTGLIGLYTDGDTANSDYDIVSDIEKINSILFTQKLDYIGTKNMASSSFAKLARGEDIGSVFGNTSTVGRSAASRDAANTTTGAPSSPGVDTGGSSSLAGLGIGEVCSVPTGAISVNNLDDAGFRDDLGAVLGGGNPPLGGATYGGGPSDPGGASTNNTPAMTNKDDFYSSLPCSENFCIKITTVPGQLSLGGGKAYSIESLIDKHAAIMNPIANSNLGCQKHSKNSYENSSKNLKLAAVLGGIKVYVQQRGPQEVKKVEKEDTKEQQTKEFEDMRRCAYVSAGLPSDKHRANIMGGEGYQLQLNTSSENVSKTVKLLSVTNPEDAALRNCMDIALGKGRARYYDSFATDLTELDVFTTSLTNIIDKFLTEHAALDKKPVDTCN